MVRFPIDILSGSRSLLEEEGFSCAIMQTATRTPANYFMAYAYLWIQRTQRLCRSTGEHPTSFYP